MTNPLSIIISCYNKRPYLAEAVQSAIANDPTTIVIVDDGSLDGSLMEAQRIASTDRRIEVVSQRNLGAAAARNTGLAQTTTKWVVFLDGDDRLRPTFAAQTLRAAQINNAEVVSGHAAMFGTRSDVWRPQTWDPYYVRYDNSLPISSLVSRSLVESVGGFNAELPFAEDWDLWIRSSSKCPVVHQLNEVVYDYRKTDSSNLSGFVEDKWDLTASLMMLANQALYNVEDLRYAVKRFVENGRVWAAPLGKHFERHPNSILLALIHGLLAEGAQDFNSATTHYVSVLSRSDSNPVALWRLGNLLYARGQNAQAYALLHQTRVIRPDFHFLVGATLTEIGKPGAELEGSGRKSS